MIDLTTALGLLRDNAGSQDARKVIDAVMAELQRLYAVEEAARRVVEGLRAEQPLIPTGDYPDLVIIAGPTRR